MTSGRLKRSFCVVKECLRNLWHRCSISTSFHKEILFIVSTLGAATLSRSLFAFLWRYLTRFSKTDSSPILSPRLNKNLFNKEFFCLFSLKWPSHLCYASIYTLLIVSRIFVLRCVSMCCEWSFFNILFRDNFSLILIKYAKFGSIPEKTGMNSKNEVQKQVQKLVD